MRSVLDEIKKVRILTEGFFVIIIYGDVLGYNLKACKYSIIS